MREIRRASAVSAVCVLMASCAAPPPPPPAAPPPAAPSPPVLRMSKDPLQLGKPCASGEATCGGGVCDLVVKNDCDAPLTCDVVVASSCRTTNGVGEATGRKRNTFAAREEGKLNIGAPCTEGEVLRTAVSSLTCK